MEQGGAVCVTGGSGFTASHIVKLLLERGYSVHTTVRDPQRRDKHEHLLALPGAAERLRVFGADLKKDGSFDEAIRGCAYVIHVAAAVTIASKNPREDVYEPTVGGTRRVLDACVKAGTVRRLVLTASSSAVRAFPKTGVTLREDMYNTTSTLEKEPYMHCKAESEKLCFEFVRNLPEGQRFEVTSLCPGYICGPVLSSNMSGSVEVFERLLSGKIPLVPRLHYSFVDARDLAEAHLLAMTRAEAAGQRYLIANRENGELWLMDAVQILRQRFPQYSLPKHHCPNFLVYLGALFEPQVSVHFMWNSLGQRMSVDNTKSMRELGVRYRPIEQTLYDTAQSLIDMGVVPKRS